jgi:tetratricopeptide (TPR) repeat protein
MRASPTVEQQCGCVPSAPTPFAHDQSGQSRGVSATQRLMPSPNRCLHRNRPRSIPGSLPPICTSLLDQSLIHRHANAVREPRFGMLETLREYALEQLVSHAEEEDIHRRHAEYFAGLGEQAAQELNAGPQHASWRERLARERDNLRTAMRWCTAAREIDTGLQLGGALWRFWFLDGTQSEREEWLNAITSLASAGGNPSLRARALNGAGALATSERHFELAHTLLGDGLAVARQLSDLHGVAFCLHNLGALAAYRADFGNASSLLEEAAATWTRAGDRRRGIITLNLLEKLLAEQGDYVNARSRCAESLAGYREVGDQVGMANSQGRLGVLAAAVGELPEASSACESALQLARAIGHSATIAWNCLAFALVKLHQQEYGAAQQLCVESLGLRDDSDRGQEHLAAALGILAGVAAGTGQYERALRLFGASERRLAPSFTMSVGPFFVRLVRAMWETVIFRALPKETVASALIAGYALSADEAVRYASKSLPSLPVDN